MNFKESWGFHWIHGKPDLATTLGFRCHLSALQLPTAPKRLNRRSRQVVRCQVRSRNPQRSRPPWGETAGGGYKAPTPKTAAPHYIFGPSGPTTGGADPHGDCGQQALLIPYGVSYSFRPPPQILY